MPCNPKNPKANDPNYECNPRTNRWIKKKLPITKTINKTKEKVKTCNPTNPKANDPNYVCNPHTNRWIKRKLPITKTRKEKIKKDKVKTKEKNVSGWEKTCKEMEKTCPMETDLMGDNWCSLDPKDVFYYVKNDKRYCYGVQEIFSIIHLGFTARDTSYEVPPLRFQLPRDSYDRSVFTKDFFTAFRKHLQKHGQLPQEPEVCYFLKYYQQFYDNPLIQNFIPQLNPDKVKLSDTIDKFLMKNRYIDINLVTGQWYWLRNKKPQDLKKFIFP